MHADSSFPMSQALCDGLPHLVDGVRAVCGPKQKSSEPPLIEWPAELQSLPLRLHEFEFVSASHRQLGAFC